MLNQREEKPTWGNDFSDKNPVTESFEVKTSQSEITEKFQSELYFLPGRRGFSPGRNRSSGQDTVQQVIDLTEPDQNPTISRVEKSAVHRENNGLQLSQPLLSSPKVLIKKLEVAYKTLPTSSGAIPKRDRIFNNFLKSLRKYLQQQFEESCPEFNSLKSSQKVEKFEKFLTAYKEELLGEKIPKKLDVSQYGGEWKGFQFIIGSFVSKETMKQMITSSREKAYFYLLQKWLKNWSQKKLAVLLKNIHLVEVIKHLFASEKIYSVLSL